MEEQNQITENLEQKKGLEKIDNISSQKVSVGKGKKIAFWILFSIVNFGAVASLIYLVNLFLVCAFNFKGNSCQDLWPIFIVPASIIILIPSIILDIFLIKNYKQGTIFESKFYNFFHKKDALIILGISLVLILQIILQKLGIDLF